MLQQAIKLALLGLDIRVATDVVLVDEDVGHAALASDLLEGILECGAVLCDSMSVRYSYAVESQTGRVSVTWRRGKSIHTDLIQLH